VVLGKSAIGDGAALGGYTDVLFGGLAATLVSNEPRSLAGIPWQEEAARRMRELLLPQVADADMGLTVTLVIRDKPAHLQLSASSFLGLQPLQSGSTSTKVIIFDGQMQNTGATARMLGQTVEAPASSAPAAPMPRAVIDAVSAPRHGSLPDAPDSDAVAEQVEAAEEYLARIR
jgi:hypothetical protein